MIKVYFDFISPYGYLGVMQVEKLAANYGRKVEWHAMLLGVSVIKVMGLKPLLDTPLKGDYAAMDVVRLASLYNIPFTMPSHGMPAPVPSARAFYWVKDQAPDKTSDFVYGVYNAQWRDGQDISNPEVLADISNSLGLDGAALVDALQSDELRKRLRDAVEAALARGVFGSPTFVVDGDMIWGCDRLWMLEHWLKHGRWAASSE